MKARRQAGFLIAKIHQSAGRIFARKLKEHGLNQINPAQGRILFVLWQQDGIPIQQLARKTSLGKSTLTSMLDRLEEAGHIKRLASGEDRRQVLIKLTRKNRKMHAAYEEVSSEMTAIFYQGFDRGEIDSLESGLSRVLENLHSAESDGKGVST